MCDANPKYQLGGYFIVHNHYCHHSYNKKISNCPLGERFEFYEQAKTAYAIIATGEKAVYANIMLQKGVV